MNHEKLQYVNKTIIGLNLRWCIESNFFQMSNFVALQD